MSESNLKSKSENWKKLTAVQDVQQIKAAKYMASIWIIGNRTMSSSVFRQIPNL
jgi:hypothetical protein